MPDPHTKFLTVPVIAGEDGKPTVAVDLPAQFAADFITRSTASMKDGRLVLDLNDAPNDYDTRVTKSATVQAFIDSALTEAGGADVEGAEQRLKTNLLSYLTQGNAVFHMLNVNEALASQRIAMVNAGDQTFDFALSLQDGEILVEHRFESRAGLGMRTEGGGVPDIELPPYSAKIVFALRPADLIRPDFDPASVRVVSADWGMNAS